MIMILTVATEQYIIILTTGGRDAASRRDIFSVN